MEAAQVGGGLEKSRACGGWLGGGQRWRGKDDGVVGGWVRGRFYFNLSFVFFYILIYLFLA